MKMLVVTGSAAALLAMPVSGAIGEKGHGQRNATGSAQSCAKTKKVGFVVRGTLTGYTADDPATTDVNEAVVTLSVTGANRHARRSGEIADQDADKKGVQVKGATFTATAADDAFKLRLVRFQGDDTPSNGDRVKVRGRIPRTKKRCAPAGTSVADRYGKPNIKRVRIADRDPDAP